MGVEGFYRFLYEALRAVQEGKGTVIQNLYYNVLMDIRTALGTRERSPYKVKTLYIDGNPIIYDVLGLSYYIGEIFGRDQVDLNIARDNLVTRTQEDVAMHAYEMVFKLITDLIEYIAPEEEVYLCFDGCVPYAKMAQQKQRRYNAMVELKHDATFDTNAISAGSLWMTEMDKYIKSRISKWMSSTEVKIKPKKFIYNSHMIPGEGEHKIMDYLRNEPKVDAPGYVVVYGNDTDLVLLSLLLDRRNIFVCNGYTFPTVISYYNNLTGEKWPKSIRDKNFVSIDNMGLAVEEHVKTKEYINDFVFMMSTIGNDFVPRTYAHSDVGKSIENIVNAINHVGKNITSDNFIDWNAVVDVLEVLYEGKEGIVKGEEEVIEKRVTDIGDGNLSAVAEIYKKEGYDIEIFRDAWYYNALAPKNKTLSRIFGFDSIKPKSRDISEMCIEFFRGMKWVYDYYRGMDVSKVWYYPYFYAPMIRDMYFVIGFLTDETDMMVLNVDIEINKTPTLLHQLVSVMPPISVQYVPEKLRPLWTVHSPIWDLMPQSVIIDKDEGQRNEYIDKNMCILNNKISVDIIDVVGKSSGVKIVPFSSYDRVNYGLVTGGYKQMKELKYLLVEDKEVVYEGIFIKERENSSSDRGRGRGENRFNRGGSSDRGNSRGGGRGFNSSRGGSRGFNSSRDGSRGFNRR